MSDQPLILALSAEIMWLSDEAKRTSDPRALTRIHERINADLDALADARDKEPSLDSPYRGIRPATTGEDRAPLASDLTTDADATH